MISFIIIGRNEGWKLVRCLKSVYAAIEYNKLNRHEVIYVDSNSIDNSIREAKKFKNIKIFKITKTYNSAIARNIGACESFGDTLFFIDGDMEISTDFLKLVYDKQKGLKYAFVSGQVTNYNYNENGVLIGNSWQYKEVIDSEKDYPTTGGIFLIKRELWVLVGGMDNRFKRGQDLDFALRLAKRGFLLRRKKEIIAIHHTTSYTHSSRRWETLISGDISYSNAFLFRKHFLNPHIYMKIFKTSYTLFALLLATLFTLITGNIFMLVIYILAVFIKVLKNKEASRAFYLDLILFYMVRDICILYYLFIPLPEISDKSIKFDIL